MYVCVWCACARCTSVHAGMQAYMPASKHAGKHANMRTMRVYSHACMHACTCIRKLARAHAQAWARGQAGAMITTCHVDNLPRTHVRSMETHKQEATRVNAAMQALRAVAHQHKFFEELVDVSRQLVAYRRTVLAGAGGVRLCMRGCTGVCVWGGGVDVRVHARMRMRVWVGVCTCVHACMHTHAHTHAHTHMDA